MAVAKARFKLRYRECEIAVDFQQQDDGHWRAWWLAQCGGTHPLNAPLTGVPGRFVTAAAAKEAGCAAAQEWIDHMKP